MGQGGKTVCASAKNVEKYSKARTAFQETRKPFSFERIKTLKISTVEKGKSLQNVAGTEKERRAGRKEDKARRRFNLKSI